MSQVTLCDICGARTGFLRTKVTIASPVHPHKDEPIHERGQQIDACLDCLPLLPDLATSHTLEDLQREVARCNAA
jgi:hypothetical protein